MKFGIISDTHNYFDPRIPKLLAGVDHILHGGDIGLPKILLELEQIAPVTAVSGNTDDPGFRYRETEVVGLSGRKFLLHHIVDPNALGEGMADRIQREQPDVVVFGHTHKPFCQYRGDILFLNPGYAGKTRFGMERSLAVLHLEKAGFRAEFLKL